MFPKRRLSGRHSLYNSTVVQHAAVQVGKRDEVLAQLRERIVRFAASHGLGEAAEDLAQEVLMVLHEKYAHLDRPEDLLPVALQVVRYKMLALRRKAARHGDWRQVSIADVPLPDLEADPAMRAERQEMLERLARAAGQLSGRCRELLRLKLEGKSFAEIQKIMGATSINTVYTWDHRCRRRLLELMGGDWEPRR